MAKKLTTVFILVFGLMTIACQEEKLPSIAEPAGQKQEVPKPALEQIDISEMPPLRPAGRIQDDETDALGNRNQIVADLVSNGKGSIPFLINQLGDETEMDRHSMNYWYQL